MGDLVQGVTILCKLLNSITNISINVDFFRLYKMNLSTNEKVQLLMTVLHRLCCFSTTTLCKGDPYKCVTGYLLKEGGTVGYYLPPDFSARQLLLCFGWLLSYGIIESCIDKLLLNSPLGKELLVELEPTTRSDLPVRPSSETPEVLSNYAALLARQIHQNLRGIASFREERAVLCDKVQQVTACYQGLPQLSSGDLQLLTKPQELSQFLTQCHPCLQLLQAYAKWQRRSQPFWKWMHSIVEEEEALAAEEIKKKEHFYKPLSESNIHHLNMFLKKVEDNVRKSALRESIRHPLNISELDTRRVSLCESKCLTREISVMDSEIETLVTICNKKKNDLQSKLLANGDILDSEINYINLVLSQISVSMSLCNSNIILET